MDLKTRLKDFLEETQAKQKILTKSLQINKNIMEQIEDEDNPDNEEYTEWEFSSWENSEAYAEAREACYRINQHLSTIDEIFSFINSITPLVK